MTLRSSWAVLFKVSISKDALRKGVGNLRLGFSYELLQLHFDPFQHAGALRSSTLGEIGSKLVLFGLQLGWPEQW